MSREALIIVDVQKDFINGSLAVPGAEEIINPVNKLLSNKSFEMIIFTADFHPKDHSSFKENGGIWPVHCVQGSDGAKLHGDINFDLIYNEDHHLIFKGENKVVDSYSAFYDNDMVTRTKLEGLLLVNGIDEVSICGLALDYCVKFTVLDALRAGFNTNVILDACKAVNINPEDEHNAEKEMFNAGAFFTNSSWY